MTTSPSTEPDPADATSKSKASSNPNHRKRCQELIGSPKLLSGQEDGVKFGPEHLNHLHNSKGSDFSIAFWLHLTEDSTGKHRSLVVRGHKLERWPVILLRPNDRRLDVGHSPSSLVFSSSGAVPLNKWVHIALVSESNKLKLFFNGVCDVHRPNHAHTNSPRHTNNKHCSLYVGKVPENAVKMDGVRGGFEGSIAFLRFYSRALSPIHVRIVYDQGPPSSVEARDRRCFQIVASLTMHRGSFLDDARWKNSLLKMFAKGSGRVAQGVVRLWAKCLPSLESSAFGGVVVQGDCIGSSSGVEAMGFVTYLLRVVGLSLWRPDFSFGAETIRSASDDGLKRFLPYLPVCISSQSSAKEDKGDSSPDESSQRPASPDLILLSNEITYLLQEMLCMEKWADVASKTIKASLRNFSDALPDPDHLAIAEGFAAMKVLSRPFETLRPGVTCTMTHSDVPATIIAYDQSSHLCHCVVNNSGLVTDSSSNSGSIVKMNGDDIILKGRGLQKEGWTSVQSSGVVPEVIVPLAVNLLNEVLAAAEAIEEDDNEDVEDGGDGGGDDEEEEEDKAVENGGESKEKSREQKETDNEDLQQPSSFDAVNLPPLTLGDDAGIDIDDDAKSFSEDVPEDKLNGNGGESKGKEDGAVPSPEDDSDEQAKRNADAIKTVFSRQALTRLLTLVHSLSLTPLQSSLLIDDLIVPLVKYAVKSDDCTACVHISAAEKAVSALRLQVLKLPTSAPVSQQRGSSSIPQVSSNEVPPAAPNFLFCGTCGSEFDPSTSSRNNLSDGAGRCDACRQADGGESGVQEDLISQLIEMGFREEWCALALRENNNDVEFASTWIVDNLDFLGSLGGVVVENGNSEFADVDEERARQDDEERLARDNLESEGCQNVYEENYFPAADPNLHYSNDRNSMHISPEADAELLLGILKARATLTQILSDFISIYLAKEGKDSSLRALFGGYEVLIHFVKLSLFRGRQFDCYRRQSDGFAHKDERLTPQFLLRPFLDELVKQDNVRSAVPRDSGDDDASNTSDGSEEDRSFIDAILTSCMDDIEAAASISAFDEMAWGSRMLAASDSQALLQPNVELASWVLDQLLSKGCTCILKGSTFQRISSFLMSANMPVKEVCMKLLWRIVVGWRIGLDTEANPTSGLPTKEEMNAMVFDHIPIGRLKRIGSQRAAEERRQDRAFMSSYTQVITQLVIGVEDLLAHIRSLETNEEEVKEELPLVLDLSMSALSENAISVTWSRPSLSYTYDVEMSTRTSLDPTTALNFTNIYSGPCDSCVVENLLPGRTYFVRARCRDPDKARVGKWCKNAEETSSPGVAFTFDRSLVGPHIFVSTDDLSASFGGNESWSTVLGSTPFITGVNSWKIRIDSSQTSYLFIGVATRQADTSSFLGGDEFGYGYIGDRALYHKRAKQKVYGEKFGQGDTIGVTLDMDKGTLSFSRNGNDLGVAFTGLAGELYPAIAFYNQGQRVSLVRNLFDCPKVGMIIDGSPASSGIDDVSSLSKLMGSMAGGHKIHAALMRDIFSGYKSWAAGHTTRFNTLCGFDLAFDCSPAALARFKVKKDEVIVTPRGQAKVVGVSNGCLWVHVEGEQGCWFHYGQQEGEAGLEEASPTEGASMATGSTASLGESDANGITYEKFAKLADSDRWHPVLDGLIVSSVNSFVERYEVSPWNLTPELLMRALKPKLQEIRVLAKTDVGDDALCCRFAVLMELNSRLVNTLPFIGVSEGIALSSRAYPGGSWFGSEGSLVIGLSADELSIEVSKQANYGAGLGLGVLLAALRSAFFFTTKKRVVATLLERTVTQAKKAEDEYDYPEDLPQVLLNRPKAIAGSKLPNPFARISLSLFGQLFDELHFIEPAQLRIGYTHPMDDGQERTFKVKFDGEGVDDYGGPYREIFGQVAGELQALNTDVTYFRGNGRKAALGQNAKCVLPLLCPTRNWRGQEGEGASVEEYSLGGDVMRSVVDQNGLFVPAPSLRSHVYMEMYSFIGQLVGMALRSRITTKFRFPPIVWKAMVGERPVVDDMKDFDEAAFSVVKQVSALGKAGAKGKEELEDFENAVGDLKFVATTSDGVEVELVPGGREKNVTIGNCQEFVRLMIEQRLHESDKALFAMRDGLASVVPATTLPLLTWNELELLVCGKEGVDIDLLQANTEYDEDVSPESEHIQSFWRVLRSFDDEDRSRFLKFVWARERLPNSSAEFHQRFKIQAAVGDGPRDHPNTYLPKAHTCFFSLNLPKYDSDEVMKEKLLYAIYNCIEMDADFKLADSENSAWLAPTEGGLSEELLYA